MAERTDYGLSAYTAAKHGVAGLTKTLALELGKFGITANYILPGAIYTGMTRQNFDRITSARCGKRRLPSAAWDSRTTSRAGRSSLLPMNQIS